MTTPVVIALRAEGTSAVLDALRSVKAAQIAAEEASVNAARDAAHKRLLILKDELVAGAKLRIDAARATEEALRRALGVNGPGARGSTVGSNTYGTIASGTGIQSIDKAAKILAEKGDMISAAATLFKGGLDLATSGLKQFASFVLSDVVKPAMALETRATQLSNDWGGSVSAKDAMGRARAIGIKNNVDPMAVLEHADKIEEMTNDAGMALNISGMLATISKGRGSDMGDLTKLAGSVYQPGMSEESLKKIILMQTAMGEMGGISIGQLAKLGPRTLAPAGGLAGDYETRLAEVGSLIQSAKGLGAGGRRVAGVQSFIDEAIKHGGAGVITDASGERKLSDPAHLIGQLLASTGGDLTKLKAAGFTGAGANLVRSYREQFQTSFNEAKGRGEDDATARKDAGKAVEDFIKTFTTANTTMESEEEKRNAVLQTSGEKWDHAMAEMKEKLLVAMPAVEKFVDAFSEHSDEIATAATALVEVMMLLGDAALTVIEWYDKLVNKHGEGDVLKTVRDKGADTSLPAMSDKGFWQKKGGLFQYVKSDNADFVASHAGGHTERVGKEGTLVTVLDDGKKKAAGKDLDLGLYGPRADLAGAPVPAAAGKDAGGGHNAADKAAEKLAGSLDKLQSKIDDVTTSMDSLNRSEAFTPGP